MNVFEIFGTIGLRDNNFSSGLDNAMDKVKSFGKVVAVGLGAAATAFTGLSIKALKLGGDLEQNLGGSEAVFKEFAATVQNIGSKAFETMGMAQSDFLATANKMGALMQGSGLSIEKSMDLSTKAMQRAADVASIMGIDISAAMESVAGAAKGNFTMMDNLGVAMNATTIEAYAMSKGIKDSWKEMDNATKVGLAMEMFLEKTAYATGNYAKENETLAGSLNTAKAALSNFLSGAGDAEVVVNSTANLADVVAKNLMELLPRLTTGLATIAQGLLPRIPELFATLLPAVIEGASSLINGFIETLPQFVEVITDSLPEIVTAFLSMAPLLLQAGVDVVTSLLEGIGKMLPKLIPAAVETVMTLMQGLTDNIPLLLEVALQLIEGFATGIVNAIPVLVEKLPDLINSLIGALLSNIPAIIDAGTTLMSALVENMPTIINAIVTALPSIIDGIVTALMDNLDNIIQAGVDLLTSMINKLPQIITIIVAAIPEIIIGITEAIVANLDTIINAGLLLFVSLIKNLPAIIIEIVKAVPEIITGIETEFKNMIPRIIDLGTNLISGIWEGIIGAATWLNDKISGFFGGVVDNIKSFFGINSPSTLFRDQIGAMIPAGLADGIEDNMGVACDASDGMAEGIIGGFAAIPAALSQSSSESLQTLQKWVADLMALVTLEIPSVINAIVLFFSELPHKIDEIYILIVNVILNWIVNMIAMVNEEFPKFVEAIVTTVNPIVDEMERIGVEMIEGFWKGIESKTGWFYNNLRKFIDGIISEIKNRLDINSPSKVMAEIGVFSAEGFINGINSMAKEARQSVSDAFNFSAANMSEFSIPKTIINNRIATTQSSSVPHGDVMYLTQNIYGSRGTPSEMQAQTRANMLNARWMWR